MTFKVNIQHGVCGADSTSLYTTDEIISYGLSGCLYAGETDLTAFVEQIVTHYETKCVVEQISVDEAVEESKAELISNIIEFLENM